MKKNITIHVDVDTIEKVKDAAYWTPDLTISQIFQEGALINLGRLVLEHGKEFEKRRKDPKSGRRPS